MPYDFYEYFLKQRENKKFRETTETVRQKLWSETYDVKMSQQQYINNIKQLLGYK